MFCGNGLVGPDPPALGSACALVRVRESMNRWWWTIFVGAECLVLFDTQTSDRDGSYENQSYWSCGGDDLGGIGRPLLVELERK